MLIHALAGRLPFLAAVAVLSSCASVSVKNVDRGTASKPQIVTVESLLLGVRPVNVIRSLGGRG